MVINRVAISLMHDAADITDDENLYLALNAKVQATSEQAKVGAMATGKPSPRVNHLVLAKKWGISPHKAVRTLKKTSQRGIRTVLHPTLTRRFKTNDRALRY